MDFTQYKKLIKDQTGLVLDHHRRDVLMDAVTDLMSEKAISSSHVYYDHIRTHPHAFSELIDRLTVNETYFFREPGHLDLLVNRIVGKRFQIGKRDAKFRVLSAGCSTGEEPYSIVMALIEAWGEKVTKQLEVVGGDIDQTALCRARTGVYGAHSFRGVKSELRQRYFYPIENSRFRIKSSIKNCVTFLNLNLLKTPYPETLKRFDVIFYRNVAIYFDPPTQRRIFENLETLLANDGYIIVSSAETLGHSHKNLSRVELDGYFLFHKSAPHNIGQRPKRTGATGNKSHKNLSMGEEREQRLKKINTIERTLPLPSDLPIPSIKIKFDKDLPMVKERSPKSVDLLSANLFQVKPLEVNISRFEPLPKKEVLNSPAKAPSPSTDLFDLLNRIRLLIRKGDVDAALERLDLLIAGNADHVELLFLKASALFQNGEHQEAGTLSLKAIEMDPLFSHAYLLLGMIDYEVGRPEDAIPRFRQVIYLEPSNWLAHFYTAEIFHRQGRQKQAKKRYERVVILLEQGNFENHGMVVFPLNFSQKELIHLCNQRIL